MQDSTDFELDQELVAGFIDETQENLEALDSLFVELEADPANLDIIATIFRPVHTIKGNSAFFGLMKTKQLAHEMETLLDLAKQGRLVPNQAVIDILLAGVDQLKEIFTRIREGQSEVEDEKLFNELIEQVIASRKIEDDTTSLWPDLFEKLEKVKADIKELDSSYADQLNEVISVVHQLKANKTPSEGHNPEVESPIESADTESFQEKGEESVQPGSTKASASEEMTKGSDTTSSPGAEQGLQAKDTGKTMRVAEENIDNFLNYVGELIVVGEMYNHLQESIAKCNLDTNLASDLRRLNETFDNLSCNLQNSIMEIRKVPIRSVLQKAPRMIRDIAADSGKEIKVEIVGDELKVDKRHIEILDGPLTHMVRNAADHGIEKVEDREKAGKPRQGTVRIEVSETEEDVILTISDDGKGIDLEAIKAKAVNLGIITSAQNLTEEQLIDMLFTSGVSTAEKVTEISGRGVGMDVVKRNIEAANGKISINTRPGQGSDFVIRLQKTVSTQIIDGFVVRIGHNCYVIPMDKVREVFRPESKDVSTVIERGQCVLRHDELLSVVKLADLFGIASVAETDENGGIMVSASTGRKRLALYVDDVIGVQKLVLKELDGLELNSNLYLAGAVMGDGTVAMVLDVDHVAGISV